jgi:hypothetical protein
VVQGGSNPLSTNIPAIGEGRTLSGLLADNRTTPWSWGVHIIDVGGFLPIRRIFTTRLHLPYSMSIVDSLTPPSELLYSGHWDPETLSVWGVWCSEHVNYFFGELNNRPLTWYKRDTVYTGRPKIIGFGYLLAQFGGSIRKTIRPT